MSERGPSSDATSTKSGNTFSGDYTTQQSGTDAGSDQQITTGTDVSDTKNTTYADSFNADAGGNAFDGSYASSATKSGSSTLEEASTAGAATDATTTAASYTDIETASGDGFSGDYTATKTTTSESGTTKTSAIDGVVLASTSSTASSSDTSTESGNLYSGASTHSGSGSSTQTSSQTSNFGSDTYQTDTSNGHGYTAGGGSNSITGDYSSQSSLTDQTDATETDTVGGQTLTGQNSNDSQSTVATDGNHLTGDYVTDDSGSSASSDTQETGDTANPVIESSSSSTYSVETQGNDFTGVATTTDLSGGAASDTDRTAVSATSANDATEANGATPSADGSVYTTRWTEIGQSTFLINGANYPTTDYMAYKYVRTIKGDTVTYTVYLLSKVEVDEGLILGVVTREWPPQQLDQQSVSLCCGLIAPGVSIRYDNSSGFDKLLQKNLDELCDLQAAAYSDQLKNQFSNQCQAFIDLMSYHSAVVKYAEGHPWQAAGLATVATVMWAGIALNTVAAVRVGVALLPVESVLLAEAGSFDAIEADTGLGTSSVGSANSIGEAAVHGNSLLSQRTAYLYRLETQNGEFLKWGVTQNMAKRYPQSFMADKFIKEVASGTRADMIQLERGLVETQPGPLNLEPWAGARTGGQP